MSERAGRICRRSLGRRDPLLLTRRAARPACRCGLTPAQSILCFGDNTWGQEGINATSNCPGSTLTGRRLKSLDYRCYNNLEYNNTPIAVVAPGVKFVALSCTAFHSCALDTSGKMLCWGRTFFDEVSWTGWRYYKRPVEVPIDGQPAAGFVTLAAGGQDCALTAQGAAFCINFGGWRWCQRSRQAGVGGSAGVAHTRPHLSTPPAVPRMRAGSSSGGRPLPIVDGPVPGNRRFLTLASQAQDYGPVCAGAAAPGKRLHVRRWGAQRQAPLPAEYLLATPPTHAPHRCTCRPCL